MMVAGDAFHWQTLALDTKIDEGDTNHLPKGYEYYGGP